MRDPQPNDAVVESVAAYSEHADEYEATHRPKMANQVERFARSLRTPSLILDAGCGPGRDLARFTSMGHVSRGIDLNPNFVAMATAHAQTSCADLRKVGSMFPVGHFDGVWSSASLVHLNEADAKDVLRQFFVLLRPGGKLYACVNTVGRTGWLDEPEAGVGIASGSPMPSHRRLPPSASAWTKSSRGRSSKSGQLAAGWRNEVEVVRRGGPERRQPMG